MKKKLQKQWDECKTDLQRWQFVIRNAEHVSMMLDNDQTSITFDGKTWHEFDGYIGWNPCAAALGKALGLKRCATI